VRTAQPIPSAALPSETVAELLDQGLFDYETTERVKYNCITAGTQLSPEWLKLCLGHTLAVQSTQVLDTYDIRFNLTSHSESAVVQLYTVFQKLAQSCSFERRGDTYLHQVLKSKLMPARKSALGWLEPPLKTLPDQYTDDTNKLVRKYIDVTAAQVLDTTHIETAIDADTFILLVSLLQETIDGIRLHCLINDDIVRHGNLPDQSEHIPHPIVLTHEFQSEKTSSVTLGYVWNNTLYTCRTGSYRLLHIILQWMEKTVAVLGSDSEAAHSLSSLLEVCVDPDRVLSSNPFSKFI
jgi:hypothetical protein